MCIMKATRAGAGLELLSQGKEDIHRPDTVFLHDTKILIGLTLEELAIKMYKRVQVQRHLKRNLEIYGVLDSRGNMLPPESRGTNGHATVIT